MASPAFQGNAFQVHAFQVGQPVTATNVLHNPVDFYMENLPQYRATGRTFEPSRGKAGEKVMMSAGARGRLSKAAPGFTVTSTKRGYD